MIDKVFNAHPRSLGESYFEHQRTALRFSRTLLAAALAAAVHALLPCLFETTASRAIMRLHEMMAARSYAERRRAGAA